MARTPMGVRIEYLVRKSGMSKLEVCAKAGMDYQALHRLICGKVKQPRGEHLQSLSEALDTTPEYLLYGKGFIRPEHNLSNRIPILSLEKTYDWCTDVLKNVLDDNYEYILNPIKELADKDCFAIKMQTDSMEGIRGYGIPKGSTVICAPTNVVIPNKYFLFYNLSLKSAFVREAMIEEKTYLKPLNPQYCMQEHAHFIKVIAQVVGCLNMFYSFN